LEALAEPGGINLSAAVFEQVQRVIAAPYVAIGPKRLKNIRDPVSVYAIAASVFARDDAVLLPSDVPTRGNRTRGFAPPAVFSLPDKPSIAVLPFSNMSTEPEQDSLADGIAEDVITALSRYPSLFVIARNSCFSYKGRAVEVGEIGRELGVRYILGGGLRKSGSRIRITAQLVQAETGNHIASSEESVGDIGFRQFAKCMIQRGFRDVEGSEAVGFSHGQFGLVIETLDDAAGELLPGAEVVQDQRAVRA
jgi:TolB-like protein